MKRQKITIGSIIKIDLGDGFHSYGRILANANYAFYVIYTKDEMEIDEIIAKPILFVVGVYDDVITKGRWEKIGKVPLEDNLKVMKNEFIQDPIDSSQFSLYNPNTGEITPATREECEGLERAAVWEAEHVEDRLRDHFAGRPSGVFERLKIK